MCGITGLWSPKDHPENIKQIKRMTSALSHRGPDADGFWQAKNTNLHFGHRRLSIIDLSADGAQPMASPCGRYHLTYNGEFYNFQELRAELEQFNPDYKGGSDTEVFLHAITHFGFEEALSKVQGMFAFALWDNREKTLTLAKDRFGKKPLYVGWAGSDLVFSSELKSFHTHPKFQKRVNAGAQSLYMRYGYIPAPNTIFENVWQLMPGCTLTVSEVDLKRLHNLAVKMTPYWSAADMAMKMHARQTLEEASGAEKTLEGLLQTAVQKRMISDVPLGAFLSGGIDSSLITALMQSTSSDKIKTYSIGFQNDELDEAPFAKKIATHLGTDHHELYVSGLDALNVIPDLPDIYDEPFSDISSIPTYLLSKFARESVTVALSGDGGDEMMGGYTRHISAPKLFFVMQKIPKFARKMFLQQFDSLPLNIQNKVDKARPFLSEETPAHLFQRLLMHSNDSDAWVQNGPLETYPLERFVSIGSNDLSAAEYMILADTIHTLPNKFLTKVDRASMANSLEVRSPFLDVDVFEYAWSLPLEMKIKHRRGKWLLRQMLKSYIPEELFERPKQGFNIPLAAWLNRDLRGWAEDLLNEPELTRNGFDAFKVLKAWEGCKDGLNIHTNKLWAVCMYQAWARKWL